VSETFSFIGVGSTPVFLKVTDGCYVRVRDISVIGVGVTSAADGSTVAPPTTVAVHMANGSYAAFEPSDTPEAAIERAGDLADAVAKAGAASFPAPVKETS
jgi:hypothetical protein